jgi:hypothetical protein
VAVTTISPIFTGASSFLLSACSGEKLTKENNRTKNKTFFMELLLSPSGISKLDSHKVSWLAATYFPLLPDAGASVD